MQGLAELVESDMQLNDAVWLEPTPGTHRVITA